MLMGLGKHVGGRRGNLRRGHKTTIQIERQSVKVRPRILPCLIVKQFGKRAHSGDFSYLGLSARRCNGGPPIKTRIGGNLTHPTGPGNRTSCDAIHRPIRCSGWE
jgi:hypothetical protein